MMNIIQQVTDPLPTNLSYIVSAKFTAIIAVMLATKLLLLLLPLLSLLPYYFATKYFATDIKSFMCG